MQVKSLLRGPSGENGTADAVAGKAAPGPRVSTPSNLDCTRMRVVKRGCVVEFPGGATARVSKVRLGSFWADGYCAPSITPCSGVRVVS